MNGMIGSLQQQAPQGQQAAPAQQGQPQQPQQGGGGTYPQNREEVAQFVNDIMRAIYSEGQPDKILKRLTTGDNLPMALGQTAGALVMTIVTRRKEENGRKPHLKLVIRGLKKALEEMSELMEMAGLPKPTPEVLQQAAQYAGQVVEQASGGGQQRPQQAPQGQPPQQQQAPPQQRPQGMM